MAFWSSAMAFWSSWATALLLLLLLLLSIVFSIAKSSAARLPPGPLALPIVGNMLQLALSGSLPHRTLAGLSLRYGPLLFLRFGCLPHVVVSSPELAREVLVTQGMAFAQRPRFKILQVAHYGAENSVILGPYGSRWRELRKLCTLQLFTAKKIREFNRLRMEEITAMLHDMAERSQNGKFAVNVRRSIGTLTENVMGRVLFTKKLTEAFYREGGTTLSEILHESSEVFQVPLIGEYIPFLSWMDFKTNKRLRRLHNSADTILEKILAEREAEPDESKNDFLAVLLTNDIGRDAMKGILVDMLGAGLDTTVASLEWALTELLRSPRAMQKLRDELNAVVGAGKMVDETHIPKLGYLNAVLNEVLRLHPPLPLLLPHASMKDCEVGGYTIPNGARVLVNAWAIARDPKVWKNPEEFQPERFVGTEIHVMGNHAELMPFGSGRRSCPGMPFGMAMVELALSNMIHCFDWQLPGGEEEAQSPDFLQEKMGVVVFKANDLEAIVLPRHTSPICS